MQQGPEAALALSIWHVQLAVVSLCCISTACLFLQPLGSMHLFSQASLPGIQAFKKGKSLEKGIALKRA